MINVTQGGYYWHQLDAPGDCPAPDVFDSPHDRISDLLGPDGEPLRVPYARPRLGFDLTPTAQQETNQ